MRYSIVIKNERYSFVFKTIKRYCFIFLKRLLQTTLIVFLLVSNCAFEWSINENFVVEIRF